MKKENNKTLTKLCKKYIQNIDDMIYCVGESMNNLSSKELGELKNIKIQDFLNNKEANKLFLKLKKIFIHEMKCDASDIKYDRDEEIKYLEKVARNNKILKEEQKYREKILKKLTAKEIKILGL